MEIENAGSCMLQRIPAPTLCNLAVKMEDDRYAEMSEKEREEFRRKQGEKMHRDNACYSCALSFDLSLAEKERIVPGAHERERTMKHELPQGSLGSFLDT